MGHLSVETEKKDITKPNFETAVIKLVFFLPENYKISLILWKMLLLS